MYPSNDKFMTLQQRQLGVKCKIEHLFIINAIFCDWGAANWTRSHLSHLITPVLLRKLELIVGQPWAYVADIWNLGALIVEILRTQRLFNRGSATDNYDSKTEQHQWEMSGLFEPFPRALPE
jgi:hypothetical protein